MKTAGKLGLATLPALAVLGFFLYFSNWIPQTAWKPPVKRQVSATMTSGELAAVGKTIVQERGCLACHTLESGVGVKGQGRGPNFFNVAARRVQGVSGGPATLAEYLAQSLYEPSAYLVEGYADIMPPAISPPAKLSYEEATAVVAYLQSLGGISSVRVGDLPRPTRGGQAPSPGQGAPSSLGDARAILDKTGCLVCHSLGGQGGNLAPALDELGKQAAARVSGLSAEAYLRQSILSPGSFVASGYPNIMPANLGDKMTASDLEALVAYLLTLRGP